MSWNVFTNFAGGPAEAKTEQGQKAGKYDHVSREDSDYQAELQKPSTALKICPTH